LPEKCPKPEEQVFSGPEMQIQPDRPETVGLFAVWGSVTVEGAAHAEGIFADDMGIDHGGAQVGMS